MSRLTRRTAMEVCQVVGEELVTATIERTELGARWAWTSRSGSGEGLFEGHPVEAYDAAFEDARLASERRARVHNHPVIAVWDYASRRGQILEIRGVGKYVYTGIDFPTEAAAKAYVDEIRSAA